jgi:para-nitrobenzyl esterase
MIRSFLLGLIGLGLVAVSALAQTPAAPPRIRTDAGWVVGTHEDAARIFRAIPYAAPPVGPLRWRPPEPAQPWQGERPATMDGPACPQAVYPGRTNAGGYAGRPARTA